jgi:HK97 family phage major capsid protein
MTEDSLLDMIFSVPSRQRLRATFRARSDYLPALRELQDQYTGTPLLKEGLKKGPRLMGYTLRVDDSVPAESPIAFG